MSDKTAFDHVSDWFKILLKGGGIPALLIGLGWITVFFGAIPVSRYDDDASAGFPALRRLRLRIGSMDLKVAAIVLSQNGLLLSRNLRDFRQVPGLRVEDWTV